MTKLNILQISDTHLFDNPDTLFFQNNPYKNLKAITTQIIQKKHIPDWIFLTGDISQDGTPRSYEQVYQLLSQFKVPIYWVLGNHDDVEQTKLLESLPLYHPLKMLIWKNWLIIGLNSSDFPKIEGKLKVSELQSLEKILQKSSQTHVIIVLHHQPVLIGSRILDQEGLKNKKDFLNILKSYPKQYTILFGHIHQAFDQLLDSIRYLGCPASSFQIVPKLSEEKIDPIGPGYRLITLKENNLITSIQRLI